MNVTTALVFLALGTSIASNAQAATIIDGLSASGAVRSISVPGAPGEQAVLLASTAVGSTTDLSRSLAAKEGALPRTGGDGPGAAARVLATALLGTVVSGADGVRPRLLLADTPALTALPEPGALVLLGTGLVVMIARLRRIKPQRVLVA